MDNTILKVKGLSKQYIIRNGLFSKKKYIHAVKNISFNIKEKEAFGLIGNSGCGKTTVANIVLRLIEPNSGTVEFMNQTITELNEKDLRNLRKDIQIVFQHTKTVLDPKMTIMELIREPLHIHHIVPEDEIEDEIDRLLTMVGISLTEKVKYPTQLSGGQNQRIIIARAISTRAKLIICDEPVSALDVSVQGQIINLLLQLKEKLNLSYLFISHDLKVVKYMCDTVAVMNAGEIIQIGPTEEILKI